MDERLALLRHFLAALAYRTQKALRGAPPSFAGFRAAQGVRNPHEIMSHMDSVLGYAVTFFEGRKYRLEPLADFHAEVLRFHRKLENLAHHLEQGTLFIGTTPERLLQGPLSDAMTHAGQLAMLRRLAESPVPPENFVFADIRADNLGPDQPSPVSPDEDWPRPASDTKVG